MLLDGAWRGRPGGWVNAKAVRQVGATGGQRLVAAIIGGRIPRTERPTGVRHVSWVSWKTAEAAGRLEFDEIAGRPPDRRFTAPYEERWSHHAEWYCGTRREAEEIGERIRNHVGVRVEVYDEAMEEKPAAGRQASRGRR
jgi:hypothetical protein